MKVNKAAFPIYPFNAIDLFKNFSNPSVQMKAAKKVRLNKRDTEKSEVDHLDKTLTEVLDVQGQLDKVSLHPSTSTMRLWFDSSRMKCQRKDYN